MSGAPTDGTGGTTVNEADGDGTVAAAGPPARGSGVVPGPARRVLAAVLLVLPTLVLLGSWLVWRDRLPSRLASHWSGLGTPDDTMSTGGFLAVSLGLAVGGGLLGAVAVLWRRFPGPARLLVVLLAGMLAGLGAATWLVSAGLTVAAGDPWEASLGAWVLVPFVAAAYGVLPAAIAPYRPAPLVTDADRLPAADGGPDGDRPQRWSTTLSSPVFAWVSLATVLLAALVVVALLLAEQTDGLVVMLAVTALSVLVLALFVRLRVTVDRRGLRVVSGVLGVPMKRIGVEQMAAVEAITELRPMEWGGWGYRVMPGRSAIVLRSGPGLVVTTTNGKQFAITLPDPATPAAALTALRAAADLTTDANSGTGVERRS